jgi:uncharacterized membrane protein YhaH (DUF805 family)
LSEVAVQVLLWLLGIGWLLLVGIVLLHVVLALVLIIPTWRVCTRAGFSGAWSLLHIIPVIGSFIVMALLAFSDWPNGEAEAGRALAGPR